MKKKTYGVAIFTLLSIAAVGIFTTVVQNDESEDMIKVTMYKSPLCGCCVQYAPYLEENGFEVDMVSTADMEAVKNEHVIPHDLQSCHTLIVGEYFVEGHVPVEAIYKLLDEQPKIDGISLPAMPAGSPGMPGIKQELFEIYSLIEGESTLFMSI